jgi:hypothetical protein
MKEQLRLEVVDSPGGLGAVFSTAGIPLGMKKCGTFEKGCTGVSEI